MMKRNANNLSFSFPKTVQFCTIILLALVVCSGAFGSGRPGECEFSTYLENGEKRSEYLALRDRLHRTADERYGTIRFLSDGSAELMFLPTDTRRAVDEMSRFCLACHDETGARGLRTENSIARKPTRMAGMAASHPLGVDYETAALANGNLKKSSELPLAMTLANGKIGCTSCHDPLNGEKGHLIKTGANTFCLSCHIL